jgi:uncharacterized OsmC-like protein
MTAARAPQDSGTLRFEVTAVTTRGGAGEVRFPGGELVRFDVAAERLAALPGPADLLTAGFAACTMKNFARFAEVLGFSYESARVQVVTERAIDPPRIATVRWVLHVTTDDPPERFRLLEANIERHGTIDNMVAVAAEITGEIVLHPVRPGRPDTAVARGN